MDKIVLHADGMNGKIMSIKRRVGGFLNRQNFKTTNFFYCRGLSLYRDLQSEEGVPSGPELFIRGAEERLAPILMTALTTGLALVPLIVTGQQTRIGN